MPNIAPPCQLIQEESSEKLVLAEYGGSEETRLLQWAEAKREVGGSMLMPKGSQKDFFDEYVYGSLIPHNHEPLAIIREVDFSFVEMR